MSKGVGDQKGAGHPADLRRFQTCIVTKHQEGALLWWQAPEAALQIVPVRDAQIVIGRGRQVEGGAGTCSGGFDAKESRRQDRT